MTMTNLREKTLTLLEFNAIQEQLAQYCVSETAANKAYHLGQQLNIEAVQASHMEINEATLMLKSGSLPPLNTQVAIRQALSMIARGMVLSPLLLYGTQSFLSDAHKLKRFLNTKSEWSPSLAIYGASIPNLEDLQTEINACISQDMVLDQASPELARVRKRILLTEDKIKDKLDRLLKHPSYQNMLQDTLIAQRGGRYVIPVKAQHKRHIEGQIHDRSASGATLFIEPEEVKKLHDELTVLKASEEQICFKIQSELTNLIAEQVTAIEVQLDIMTHCDWTFARGRLSRAMNGSAPRLSKDMGFKLVEARHPLLGKEAVPLNLQLDAQKRGLIITGPNTGGKTVAMKTAGLLCQMALSGLHIPADESSVIGWVRQILADIGDGQSISQSLSTFSSHMTNIADILEAADERSLVLFDEIGSGTDPREGMGIAIAILEAIYDKGSLIIASTHYGEIKTFGESHVGFINGAMGFDPVSLKPLYQLTVGKSGESNGIWIAKRLGMPQAIIERAMVLAGTDALPHIGRPHSQSVETSFNEMPNLVPNQTLEPIAPKVQLISEQEAEEEARKGFVIGDQVKVPYLDLTGMVTALANGKGEIEIQVRDKRMRVPEKRVVLYIEKSALYPENYDMAVVLKSKDYRKKNKLINKGKGKGLVIEY